MNEVLESYPVTWHSAIGARPLLKDLEAHELSTELAGARITMLGLRPGR